MTIIFIILQHQNKKGHIMTKEEQEFMIAEAQFWKKIIEINLNPKLLIWEAKLAKRLYDCENKYLLGA